MKLNFCTQGFFKMWNLIKLIIFDEIENFRLFKCNFCHFGAQKMGQNCDYFPKSENFAHKGFLMSSIT